MHRKWIGLMAKGAASHVLLLQDAKPLPPASLHRQAAPPKKRTAAPNTCERKQQKRARTSRSVVVKMFFLAAMVLRLVVAWCLILGWDGDDPCACALEGVGSKKEGLNECLRGYTYAKDKLRLVLLVLSGSVCVFLYHRHSTKRRKRCFLSLAAICGSQPLFSAHFNERSSGNRQGNVDVLPAFAAPRPVAVQSVSTLCSSCSILPDYSPSYRHLAIIKASNIIIIIIP